MNDRGSVDEPEASRTNLEVIQGGRVDHVNSSDRVSLGDLALNLETDIGPVSRKELTTIPNRKPRRESYFRVWPGDDHTVTVAGLKIGDPQELYLTAGPVRTTLATELGYYRLYVTVTRDGDLGVWSIPLPRTDGRITGWTRSALEAANIAMSQWVRIAANMGIGAYELHRLLVPIPEPKWPDLTLEQILRIAFRDHIIDSTDHPLVRQLQGLA